MREKVERKRKSKDGDVVQHTLGQNGAVVGRDDRVMVVCAHLFTDGNTVDVARRFAEREFIVPVLTIRFPGCDVHQRGWGG